MKSNEKINDLHNPAFDNLYQNKLFEFKNYISNVSNGIFIVTKEEIGDFSTELIQKAQKSIIATSYIKKSNWWDTPWGKEYEAINYKLAKKGIIITRYFIFSTKEEYENSISFLEKQEENGIKVYHILSNQINGDYNQDVILIDDKIGGKLLLNPDKEMTKAEMIIDEKNLYEIKKIIKQLNNSISK